MRLLAAIYSPDATQEVLRDRVDDSIAAVLEQASVASQRCATAGERFASLKCSSKNVTSPVSTE